MRDTAHVLKLMLNFGTNAPSGEQRGRKNPEGPGYLSFQYPTLVNYYYEARHAVDDNNNIRQGSYSFEALMGSKQWHTRQFHALVAIAETNAYLGFSHFVRSAQPDKADVGLRKFRLALAQQLIEHPLYAEERATDHPAPGVAPVATRKRGAAVAFTAHRLVTADLHSGRFDGHGFQHAANPYQKHTCRTRGCTKQVRTYCPCKPGEWLCDDCFFSEHLPSVA